MAGILKNLDRDGTPPANRLGDAYDSQQLFSQLIYRNQNRSQLNALVQGAMDGNRPIPQATLDAEGLSFLTNVNWGYLGADVNQAQVPFYMLFADVPNYICVQVNPPNYQPVEWAQMGQIIEEELTRLLNDWDPFDFRMQLGIRNGQAFGKGPLYFQNKEDFRFEVAPENTVYVDDETTQDLSKLNLLYIYYEWGLPELYDAISQEGAEEFWDVEAVKELLTTACNTAAKTGGWQRARNWVYWQNKLRDHDTWFWTIDAKICTAWGYIREFKKKGDATGKITRTLIVVDPSTQSGKFLYKKTGEFDSWDQIIHPMFSEIGNGHWNGVKGLGVKAYNARDAQNRLKNRLVDAAMIGAQIILQAEDEKALDAFQIGQLGPYSVINKKITPMPTQQFATALDKPMAVAQSLEFDLRSNIGNLRHNMSNPGSVQPVSAEQAAITASYENQLSLGQQTMWLRQLDKLYREMCKRLFVKPREESKEYPHEDWEVLAYDFHKRCRDRGVPEAAFKHVKSIKAYRSIGRGSEYLKQQQSLQTYAMLRADPNVPEAVVVKALRGAVAAVCGRDALDMLWPNQELVMSPTDDASKAQDENAGMLWGVEPIWTADQNNLAHAATHLQFGVARLQLVQQGQMDPAQYLSFAQVAIPHTEFTIGKIQGERKKGTAYQAMWNAFQQWVAQTTQLSQQFAAAQEAQAEEQQRMAIMQQQAIATGQLQDPETQLGMAKIQSQHALGMAKIESNAALKARKDDLQMQGKAIQQNQNMAIKDLQTAQQLEINRAKTQSDIQNSREKAKSTPRQS